MSRETTFLSGPINPDGTINYLAAINQIQSEGVTSENNAAIPMLRALGPEMIDPQVRQTVLRQLGAPELPPEGEYFITFGDFVRKNRPDLLRRPSDGKIVPAQVGLIGHRVLASQGVGLSLQDRALLDAWLAVNRRPLEILAQAAQRSRFFVPLADSSSPPRMASSHSAKVYLCGDAGEALGLRAGSRVTDGDLDGAWRDAQVMHRLAALCSQQISTIGYLIGVMIDDQASRVDARIACCPSLPADRALAMLRSLQSMPDSRTIERAMDLGERCERLDRVMQVMRSPATLRSGASVPLHRIGAFDFNWILRNINAEMDDEIVVLRVADRAERERLVEKHKVEFPQSSADRTTTDWVWGILCYCVSPPRVRLQLQAEQLYRKTREFTVELASGMDSGRLAAVVRRQLAQTAFALAAWHAERGDYPRSLSELMPDYLAQVPLDAFSSKPLLYRANESGYLLYSVGINGRDDSGVFSGDTGADDITVAVAPAKGN